LIGKVYRRPYLRLTNVQVAQSKLVGAVRVELTVFTNEGVDLQSAGAHAIAPIHPYNF